MSFLRCQQTGGQRQRSNMKRSTKKRTAEEQSREAAFTLCPIEPLAEHLGAAYVLRRVDPRKVLIQALANQRTARMQLSLAAPARPTCRCYWLRLRGAQSPRRVGETGKLRIRSLPQPNKR